MMVDGFKEWEDQWFLENAPEIEMIKDNYRKTMKYQVARFAGSMASLFAESGKVLIENEDERVKE